MTKRVAKKATKGQEVDPYEKATLQDAGDVATLARLAAMQADAIRDEFLNPTVKKRCALAVSLAEALEKAAEELAKAIRAAMRKGAVNLAA